MVAAPGLSQPHADSLSHGPGVLRASQQRLCTVAAHLEGGELEPQDFRAGVASKSRVLLSSGEPRSCLSPAPCRLPAEGLSA